MCIPIIIPAYQPENALVPFVKELIEKTGEPVVIINDGSHAGKNIFSALRLIQNCHVIEHAVNLGKGAALKTGINYSLCTFKNINGVVTADADGQHTVKDIARTRDLLAIRSEKLILGSRSWQGPIPLRSKMGNLLTKYVFWFLTAIWLQDTQSGLRGIPVSLCKKMLRIKTVGYDFELDVLVLCKTLCI